MILHQICSGYSASDLLWLFCIRSALVILHQICSGYSASDLLWFCYAPDLLLYNDAKYDHMQICSGMLIYN